MTPLTISLVLTAALLHATWNALAKSSGVPQYSIAAYHLVGAIICVFIAFFIPLPNPQSWPLIAITIVIHNLYYFSLSGAYRTGDLSQVYPLFRGLSPLLVAIGAYFLADEKLSLSSIFSIIFVCLGIMSMAFFKLQFGRLSKQALFWTISTAILIAGYTLIDGLGVRLAGNSLSYIAWTFILEPIPIVSVLLIRDRKKWLDYVHNNKGVIVIGGLASSLAYGLVIFAMSLGSMAIVSSLRETSVIFAAIIGSLFFKEPFAKQRIMVAFVIAIGVILMRIL